MIPPCVTINIVNNIDQLLTIARSRADSWLNGAEERTMKGPWNLGIKVRDLDAELAFLDACGATQIQKGMTRGNDGDEAYGMAFLGPQRLLLFPHVLYEDKLAEPLKYGLAHAVFEVPAVDEVVQRLERRGIRPIWGPANVPSAFGHRRRAFFRSPSGFVFETFEHLP